MQRTLVIYESRYGSTKGAAEKISLVLGPSKLIRPEGFEERYSGFDFLVLGTPVYGGAIDSRIKTFVEDNLEWLKEKRPVLFCTCLDPRDGLRALGRLKKVLGGDVLGMRALGGRIDLEGLRDEDRRALEEFSKRTGASLADVDTLTAETVVDYALELKRMRDLSIKRMPLDALRVKVDEFLKSHNTCALATAGRNPRATPVEYLYLGGKIYILSEGGEKFANLLLNPRVSLAIYDSYQSREKLAGMQLTGRASLTDPKDPEYEDVAIARGTTAEKLRSLPFDLNLLRIDLERIEFLNAEFGRQGYDVRQVLTF